MPAAPALVYRSAAGRAFTGRRGAGVPGAVGHRVPVVVALAVEVAVGVAAHDDAHRDVVLADDAEPAAGVAPAGTPVRERRDMRLFISRLVYYILI